MIESRNRTSRLRLSVLATCLAVAGYAQTAPCPTLTNETSSTGVTAKGLLNTAQVDVEVVDTTQGDFDAGQVQAITDAIDGIAGVPGSNVDYSVTNTDTMPSTAGATAQNPINIVEIGTQDQINALRSDCQGKPACTNASLDSNGYTTSSVTIMLASTAANSLLEPTQLHEFGHADAGLNDCSGDNCQNSMMDDDVESTSPTAPTPCDATAIKNEQQCK